MYYSAHFDKTNTQHTSIECLPRCLFLNIGWSALGIENGTNLCDCLELLFFRLQIRASMRKYRVSATDSCVAPRLKPTSASFLFRSLFYLKISMGVSWLLLANNRLFLRAYSLRWNCYFIRYTSTYINNEDMKCRGGARDRNSILGFILGNK